MTKEKPLVEQFEDLHCETCGATTFFNYVHRVNVEEAIKKLKYRLFDEHSIKIINEICGDFK